MNNVSYFEIQTHDPQKAQAFYSEVFGWTFEKDNTIPVDYWRIQGAGLFGGLLKRPAPIPPQPAGTNAYVCSVEVEDFGAIAEKIKKNGGQVALGKFAVVGKCWQGYFTDPQ